MTKTSDKQKIYLVGPIDHGINDMFNNTPNYRMTPYHEEADILCFQGGSDVNPKIYGEEKLPKTYISEGADAEDLAFWNMYPATPKVGICRGGQFLNVMSGGKLWQNVNNHNRAHEIINLIDIPFSVYEASKVYEVTSVHHQMMIAHPDLGEVLAIADEATVFESANKSQKSPVYDTEVVWYEHTKCLCFQPHPEYNEKYATRSYFLALMRYLIG